MKFTKRLKYILVSICMPLILAGCQQQEPVYEGPPIVSVILIGNHANSQTLDIQLDAMIKRIYSSFGNIGIIVIDGNPTLLYDENSTNISGCYGQEYLQEAKKTCQDNYPYWSEHYLNPQIREAVDLLDTCKADNSEVDTLGALRAAAESLHAMESSMGTTVEKEIIIMDTGLSTSGSFNFLNPNFQKLLSCNSKIWENESASADLTNLIKQLEDTAEIPDLEDIRITWYGLGQTSDPQPPLSNLNIQNLQYIWGELLKRTGCLPSNEANADEEFGIFVPTSAHGKIECDQYVTPIQLDFAEDSILPIHPELSEQKITFHPNTDEYLFPEEIEHILKPYVSASQDYSDKMVLLVGTTSSWNGGSQKLSEERAERVKSSMIEFGIPEDYISIIGLGYDLNICQDDSPKGEFEESIAQGNRSVLILPYNSPKAQDILFRNR